MTPILLDGILRNKSSVGLTLGEGGVHAVRLVRSGEGYKLEGGVSAVFQPDMPPRPAETEAVIRQIKDSLIDEKTGVSVGLSGKQSDLRFFGLPFSNADKINRVLRYEAEPLFLHPVDDFVLDFHKLGYENGGVQQGVIIGARPENVSLLLDLLAAADLDPHTVLPEKIGLIAAGRQIFKDQQPGDIHVLVDFGAGQTGLAVFDGNRPLAVRTIFFGGRDLTLSLAQAGGMEPNDAEELKQRTDLSGLDDSSPGPAAGWELLIREIERTVGAVDLDDEESRPVLVPVGGGAHTPGLEDFLQKRTGLKVQPLSDFNPVEGGLAPEQVVPFGLAVLGLEAGRRPNLRQGDLAPQKVLIRYSRSIGFMAAGCILALILGLGNFFYNYNADLQKYRAAKAGINRLFMETAPHITRVVNPLAQLRQEVEKAQSAAGGMGAAEGGALEILLGVSRLAGAYEGLRITDLNLGPQRLELTGEGNSYEIIDRLTKQLENLPYFTDANIGGARTDPNTKVLTFRISLTRKGG